MKRFFTLDVEYVQQEMMGWFMFYPDEIIEEVRMNNDIVTVVSEYLKLEKKGSYLFGLCPFHREKTPSFSVTPSKQIFYCYSCQKGGNVIQFIMNVENLDFVEAVKYLADKARIQLPEGEDEGQKERIRVKQEIININTEAARFFFQCLLKNTNAMDYLKKRGTHQNTLRKFGIGYSKGEWDALYKYLVSKGFEEEHIFKSGLVLPKKSGGYYDRFRDRIMFPIFDIRGNVIGFGGRVMDASMPKYMNSPETMAYNKGKSLYALNFAKNSGEKKLIVVEGYMDVISLHQAGITNTVASLGTALTESQGRILKKYAEEIIISYDADAAGQAATMRGLDLLNHAGCNVKVLMIPQGKDPDEFIRKHGVDEFKKRINQAISLIEYKVKVLKNTIDTRTTEGKIKLLNEIANLLAKLDNRVEREMYVKKFAREYEISEESLYAEILRRTKPEKSFKSRVVQVGSSNLKRKRSPMADEDSKITHFERVLLAFLCVDPSVYRVVEDKISIEMFNDGENRRIAGILLERLKSNRGMVPAELLNLSNDENSGAFTKIFQEECNCEDNKKAVLDIIKRIRLFQLEKRQQEIIKLLGNKEGKRQEDVEKLKSELMLIITKIKDM